MKDDRQADREALRDTTSREDRAERRRQLRCSICPPHRKENEGRRTKHGKQKPRYKDRP